MNQELWMSNLSAYGPAYNAAFDSTSGMFYDNMRSPRLGKSPSAMPMPPFPQYPSMIQPSLNSNNSSINMSSFNKPFQNNFMYFEPRPQPQPMPMNYAMAPSMMMPPPMFAGAGRENCDSWCNSSLQRLIRDDEMYFGRSGMDTSSTKEYAGNGAGCQAGWLPDDSQNNSWLPEDSQKNSWLRFDPNTTLRPLGMPAAATQSPESAAWQRGSGSYGERQLLPDI